MQIRPELPEDIVSIHEVETAAFQREAEADLVDQIRAHGRSLLSWVAVHPETGQIVGHVLFSPASIRSGSSEIPAVGMGPVAVLPEFQNQGIGSHLIRKGLDELRQAGHAIVVVAGNPAYYQRFGFQDATPRGLICQFEMPPGCFMAIELHPGALSGVSGTVYYTPEFEMVE